MEGGFRRVDDLGRSIMIFAEDSRSSTLRRGQTNGEGVLALATLASNLAADLTWERLAHPHEGKRVIGKNCTTMGSKVS